MTQDEKSLLLKDLCARLPYGIVLDVDTTDWKAPQGHIQLKIEWIGILFKDMSLIVNGSYYGDNYKPYLRPMSSMTEEEVNKLFEILDIHEDNAKEWLKVNDDGTIRLFTEEGKDFYEIAEAMDYLYSIHVDFRGLIEKGLAIEITKENNPYKD